LPLSRVPTFVDFSRLLKLASLVPVCRPRKRPSPGFACLPPSSPARPPAHLPACLPPPPPHKLASLVPVCRPRKRPLPGFACLPPSLPARLPACLPACLPAFLPVLSACLAGCPACLHSATPSLDTHPRLHCGDACPPTPPAYNGAIRVCSERAGQQRSLPGAHHSFLQVRACCPSRIASLLLRLLVLLLLLLLLLGTPERYDIQHG
jgi:hypothetical protein